MKNMYLPNSIMLEMLKKVQNLQSEIIISGRSCHLDAGVHEDLFFEGGTHISFDVTVFDENELVRQFDFSSNLNEEELNAEYQCLVAYVNRIKSE